MATLLNSAKSNFAGVDPAVATITEPTSGNLIIAVCSERSGGDASNHALTGITGWTHTIAQTIEQADGSHRRSHSVFWKVAGASEGTSVTFDDASSNVKWLTVYEYEFGGSEDQWILLDSTSNDNGTTDGGTTISTGTTGSQSGEMFIFGSAVLKRTTNGSATGPWSWDTGLSLDVTFEGGSGDMDHGVGSDAEDLVTGTKSSTMTLTDHRNNLGLSGAILVFDTVSGGTIEIVEPLPILSYRHSGRYV